MPEPTLADEHNLLAFKAALERLLVKLGPVPIPVEWVERCRPARRYTVIVTAKVKNPTQIYHSVLS